MVKGKVFYQPDYSKNIIVQLEQKYGLTSEEFMELVSMGKCPEEIMSTDVGEWIDNIEALRRFFGGQVSSEVTIDDLKEIGFQVKSGKEELSCGYGAVDPPFLKEGILCENYEDSFGGFPESSNFFRGNGFNGYQVIFSKKIFSVVKKDC